MLALVGGLIGITVKSVKALLKRENFGVDILAKCCHIGCQFLLREYRCCSHVLLSCLKVVNLPRSMLRQILEGYQSDQICSFDGSCSSGWS